MDTRLEKLLWYQKSSEKISKIFIKIQKCSKSFETTFFLHHSRPSFEVLDVWLENLAKHLSQGRTPSTKLRFDIENFKDPPSSSFDSPPSAKKIDTRLSTSRSPSPLNKKSDFILNSAMTEPEAISTIDIEDSGPSSIIMTMADVSATTNGISFTTTAASTTTITTSPPFNSNNSNSKHSFSEIDNNCSSHSSCSFIANDKCIDQQVPSTNENMSSEYSPFIREIPKSPHLSKDFSPNGERLRNSLRFRRQERIQKQRSLRSLANLISQQSSCSWDSGNENSISSANTDDFETDRPPNYFNFPKLPLTDANNIKQIGKKSKPYGEKGFIIHVNDGSLTLNDVKDLNNCYSDDFDSSCDTSLNYIDPDSLNVSIENGISPKMVEKAFISPKTLKNCTFEVVLPENDDSIDEIKYSLDEVRENLNKCKSKLDALDIKDAKSMKKTAKTKSKLAKVSLNDMLTANKKDQAVLVASKQTTASVFARLHPANASPVLNNRSLNSRKYFEPANKLATKKSEVQNGGGLNGSGQNMSTLTGSALNGSALTGSTLNGSTQNGSTQNSSAQNGSTQASTQNGNKTAQKNYCKNTLAFIEKISDGLSDRHQKPHQHDKKSGNKKINSTTAQETITRKPPAPTSPKKLPTMVRNTEKQKKPNPHASPTRKRL